MAETLKNKIRKLNEFIRRLQRLDNRSKKKWLIGLTAAAMAIFIGIWLLYLTAFGLPKIASPKPAEKENGPTIKEESFLEIFQRGWREINGQISDAFQKTEKIINEQVAKSNEIILNNSTSAPATSAATGAIDIATTTQE